MTSVLTFLLASSLVFGPLAEAGASASTNKTIQVTSARGDLDGKEGVVMLEGDVKVQYADDYTMCSDRLFLFASKANELSRIVALGHVTISNGTRVGTCAMATYRRRRNEIEMFWDGTNAMARLAESGKDASALEGTRIRFWIDTEQAEVENSRISVGQEKGRKLL